VKRNYYSVLGLPQTATAAEIKIKFRELARKYHPDLCEDKAFGLRIFKQINEAYRVLSDPERKTEYDAKVALEAATRLTEAETIGQAVAARAVLATVAPKAEASPEVVTLLRKADAAMMRGEASQAREACEAVLKTDPENLDALEILGDALAILRKTDEAILVYRKVLKIAPSFVLEARLRQLEVVSAQLGGAKSGKGRPETQKLRRNLLDRLFRRHRRQRCRTSIPV